MDMLFNIPYISATGDILLLVLGAVFVLGVVAILFLGSDE